MDVNKKKFNDLMAQANDMRKEEEKTKMAMLLNRQIKRKTHFEEIDLRENQFLGEDKQIYCSLCKTNISVYFKEYDKTVFVKCECKLKEIEEKNKKIELEEHIKKTYKKLQDIGINPERYGFDKFNILEEWQQKMYDACIEFLKEPTKGIIFTGQSGGGKTLLLSSTVKKLIHNGEIVAYLKWLEQGKYLKGITNDGDIYKKELNKYKKANILYIDDFLKVGRNGNPTEADISLAFDILDYRVEHNLPTMISTERTLKEIHSMDEATCGRLYELCKIRFDIKKDDKKNYRFK